MVISSPCLIDNKELTSPEQTALAKDFSNPLLVDSLLKTIWSSVHHVFTLKHWLVQSKRLLSLQIEPSPSHSPEPSTQHSPDHTTAAVSFPSPTQPTQPSPGAEQHIPTPHDSPLHAVHSHRSDEGSLKLNELTNLVTKLFDRVAVLEDDLRKTKKTYSSALTKLILRVKKLEARVKIGKSRKRAKVVLSEDDADVQDDSSKQGRKLTDAEVQEKASTETEPFIQEVTPTEVIQDQGSSEKGSAEVSTAGATKGTASEVHHQTEEQMNEEQRAQIAQEKKLPRQLYKESKKKKSLPRKRRTVKRQKLEEDAEKEELKGVLDIIPREEFAEDVESLSTKYPIVDW
ncbi:hypothetical protein Tco_1548511 [Tanacetum coccineum]